MDQTSLEQAIAVLKAPQQFSEAQREHAQSVCNEFVAQNHKNWQGVFDFFF